jgi:uncharacterized protein YoxC
MLVTLAIVGLAILVAAAVTTLLQLLRTLRSAETLLEALSPRFDRALEEASGAFAKVSSVATQVEKGAAALQVTIERAHGLAATMAELGESLGGVSRFTAVAGRAVAMAVRTLGIGRRSAPADLPDPGGSNA